jgi:hypothetical protein
VVWGARGGECDLVVLVHQRWRFVLHDQRDLGRQLLDAERQSKQAREK